MSHKISSSFSEQENFSQRKEQINNCILIVKNLSFYYDQKKALDNINLSVKKNEIVTILGPNGGGKTSFIRILVGIYKNYTGNITYVNNPVIGYLPQHFNVNNLIPMTVRYFLESSFSKKNKKLSINDIFSNINLKRIINQQVCEISEGELQLVLLARCLMLQPDLIILDEPVSCMDVNAKNDFYKLVARLVDEHHLSIIMTSHDLQLVMLNSDRVICINRSIFCEGKPSEISQHKNFKKMFGA